MRIVLRVIFFSMVVLQLKASDKGIDSLLSRARSVMYVSVDSMMFFADQAMLQYNSVETDGDLLARILNVKGSAYLMRGDIDSAQLYYFQGLDNVGSDQSVKADILKVLGISFSMKRDYSQALKSLIASAEIFERLKDISNLAKVYNNLGIVFRASNNDTSSIHYLRKASQINRSLDNLENLLGNYINLADAYRNTIDSCFFYADKGYTLAESLEDAHGLAKSSELLSGVYRDKQEYSKALWYTELGYNIYLKIGDFGSLANIVFRKASILSKQGQHDQSIRVMQSFKKDYPRYYQNLSMEFSYLLFENNKALGKYESALENLEAFMTENKEALGRDKANAVVEIQTKYETEKKEQQISNLEKENEIQTLRLSQQRILIFTSIVILTLIIFSGYLFYQKRLLREKEKATLHKQQLLRSQMNPHFIFNALTSIRGFLFEKHDLKEAVAYLGKFAKLMRLVLEHSSRESVTLKEEIEALEIYMEIQKMRFNNGFDYTLNIDPTIELEQTKVPPLLAQPFIENAIEHGFKNIPYEGKVEFSCKSEGDFIRFSIVDNGIGIDHVSAEKRHESKALSIFKERIGILAKSLKLRLSFIIKDLGSTSSTTGTKIEYTLPANWKHA